MELSLMKELIGILMESEFYFDLSPRERLCLIRYLLGTSCLEANR